MIDICAKFALAKDDTMMGPLVARIIWESDVGEEKELLITFPANISREDYERMVIEIRAALQQAACIGVQKVLAKIAARGG